MAGRPGGDPAESGGKKEKKGKSRHRKPLVIGVIVVIVVVCAIGFNFWHEQPSFCNSVCHVSMDVYVESAVDGTHDKYGNELDSDGANAMMAHLHIKDGDTNCLGCHEPTIGEQLSEGMHWVTGDYDVQGPTKTGEWMLVERTWDQLTEARGASSNDQLCLVSGCHVTDDGTDILTKDQLKAQTASLSSTRNPHETEFPDSHTTVACEDCHKGHTQSVNACSQCHSDAPIPTGWLSSADASKIQTINSSN